MAGPFLTQADVTALVGQRVAAPPADGTGVLYRDTLSTTGTSWRPLRPVANVSASSTVTVADPALDDVTVVTLTGNVTVAFPVAGTGKAFTLVLKQDSTGGRTVTLPAGIAWPGATAPTLSTTGGRSNVLRFVCYDGATWWGNLQMANVG